MIASDCPHSWDCDRPACGHHVPPVPGDPLRRRPVCGLALVEESARVGGMSQPTIAWLLGISTSRVCQLEKNATRKVRLALV